jgi:predicted acylesterase/phospholipase RssA
MNRKYSLFLSGTTDKVKHNVGGAIACIENWGFPQEIIAVSGTAYASLFLVTNNLEKARKLNFDAKTIFDRNIYSVWGILVAFFNMIIGRGEFWGYKGIDKFIKKHISEEQWRKYINSNLPPIYVNSTEFSTNKEVIFNLKDCTNLNEALLRCRASASIPGYTKEVKINNRYYIDGSYSSHLAIEIGEKYLTTNDIVAIFARPEKYTPVSTPRNPLKKLVLGKQMLLFRVSVDDEKYLDGLPIQGVRVRKVHAPRTLLSFYFIVTKEQNEEFFKLGYENTLKVL